MSFKKQITDFDLGITSIENIFINDFMPMANGTAVKVYLFAFKYCNDQNSSKKFTNKTIANHLEIPLEDVLRSWDFWEKKGIIQKITIDDTNDYEITFLSLRQLVAKSIYSTTTKIINENGKIGNNLNIIEANKNPAIRKMFYNIDQTMRRQLVPNERNTVLDWIYKQNINIDIIEQAFKYCIETRGVKHINYVSSVVRSWHDNAILTIEDLNEHFSKNNLHFNNYKIIYRTLGYANKLPSAGDKEIMDIWLDKYKLDIDFIVKVLTESSKKTSNINMNYVNKTIENLFNLGITTLEKYQIHLEETKKTKTNKVATSNKNKFHNFKQRDNKYTNEELEKKLGIRK